MFLSNYTDSFKEKKILIVGDVMLDSYLWGKVERISPEAPVPILSRSRRELRLGGAANVARNLKYLGATPIVCSVIGEDANALEFRKLLVEKNEIPDKYLINDPERPTTIKTRIISNGQQLLRVDDELTKEVNETAEQQLKDNILACINEEKVDGIIIEDYDKGTITKGLIEFITMQSKMAEIPVFVDPKKKLFADYKNVTVFKPNFSEFISGINLPLEKDDFEGIKMAAEQYRKENNIDNILITLSEHGMLLSGDETFRIEAQKRDIADVSGAGDTVISVFALCYCSGMKIKMAAQAANIAGGLVCTKPGVVPIELNELLAECERVYKI